MEAGRHPHVSSEFEGELAELRAKLLLMASKVEGLIASVIDALVARDSAIAEDVVLRDGEVDALEKEVDELCIMILALRQPAASDLRRITTALKVVTDLERMGDLCVNIARAAIELAREPEVKPYVDMPGMARAVRDMVRRSLDAFVFEDPELAREVVCTDLDVDRLYKRIFGQVLEAMTASPAAAGSLARHLLVARHLERIGDHATNIAEQVIFLVVGRDVRHEKARLRAAGRAGTAPGPEGQGPSSGIPPT